MSDSSARLALPYILPAQAQKHVTHNEAIERLDLLVQLTVEDFAATAPPSQPAEGAVWALGPAPTGDWAGEGNKLAARTIGGWLFITPQPGWIAAQGSDLRIWDGTAWGPTAETLAETVPGLGVNTSFDMTNRLAVASDATLLTHDGQGHQLKLNKQTASDTASLLFQTDFSGRAEMGTAGSDAFEIKVSADGSNWHTALQTDPATGRLSAPNGAQIDGAVTGSAVTQTVTDATAGRLMKVGDFGLGSDNSPVLTDLDAFTTRQGFYAVNHSTVAGTKPATGTVADALLVMRPAANQIHQIYSAANSGVTCIRKSNGTSSWGPWRQIETISGSNANGSWVRLPDGTQMCSHILDFDDLVSGVVGQKIWTYPAAFLVTPVGTAMHIGAGLQASLDASIITGPAATATVFCRHQIGGAWSRKVSAFAIGRWF